MADNRKIHSGITEITWSSGVSAMRENAPPFVSLRIMLENGDMVIGTMDLPEARDTAAALLACIEASDGDSAFFRFGIEELGMTEASAAQMLNLLRQYRESMND